MLDVDKLHLVKFELLKSVIDVPENFDGLNAASFNTELDFSAGLDYENKVFRTVLKVKIVMQSENEKKAVSSHHFSYFFYVENLEELVVEENQSAVDSDLTAALAAISYSTSRGVLFTRLKDTVFEKFILPIISPNELLKKNN